MKQVGLSQSELARRVGVSQQNIGHLLSGNAQGSKRLHLIARELQTTPAYLSGEIDDPAEGAPPPPPAQPIRVMMEVVLPPETALAEMFEALLSGIDPAASLAERAQLLAQRLPIGLSQLRDLRPSATRGPARRRERVEADAHPAMPHHEPTQ